MPAETDTTSWCLIDLPLIDYKLAWGLQTSLVAVRKEKIINSDMVLFLEHPPVCTLDRRGELENLCVSGSFFEKSGISVIKVERGGNITYHGLGQLVVYPIINLKDKRLGITELVSNLEEPMIGTSGEWGIKAERKRKNPGIWVGNNKLGSIGLAVRKDITFQALTLNVNMLLEPFDIINPCELQGIGMTSMQKEFSKPVPMSQVQENIKTHLQFIFKIDFYGLKIDSIDQTYSPVIFTMIKNFINKKEKYNHTHDYNKKYISLKMM